jgi:hypothetical protein
MHFVQGRLRHVALGSECRSRILHGPQQKAFWVYCHGATIQCVFTGRGRLRQGSLLAAFLLLGIADKCISNFAGMPAYAR